MLSQLIIVGALIASATPDTIPLPPPPPPIIAPAPPNFTPAKNHALTLIKKSAARYHLTPVKTEQLTRTLECESGLDSAATGDQGEVGIAQIHPKYWPEISETKARDPAFAIDFAAKWFARGHASWWSCYNDLYATIVAVGKKES